MRENHRGAHIAPSMRSASTNVVEILPCRDGVTKPVFGVLRPSSGRLAASWDGCFGLRSEAYPADSPSSPLFLVVVVIKPDGGDEINAPRRCLSRPARLKPLGSPPFNFEFSRSMVTMPLSMTCPTMWNLAWF